MIQLINLVFSIFVYRYAAMSIYFVQGYVGLIKFRLSRNDFQMAGESSQGSRDHKGSERIVQSGQLGGDDKATGSGSANNLKMM